MTKKELKEMIKASIVNEMHCSKEVREQEEEDMRRRNRNRTGRRATILTTSSGLDEIEDENIKKKSLLGG